MLRSLTYEQEQIADIRTVSLLLYGLSPQHLYMTMVHCHVTCNVTCTCKLTIALVRRKSPPWSGETRIEVTVSLWPVMLKRTAFRLKSQALITFSMPPVYTCTVKATSDSHKVHKPSCVISEQNAWPADVCNCELCTKALMGNISFKGKKNSNEQAFGFLDSAFLNSDLASLPDR